MMALGTCHHLQTSIERVFVAAKSFTCSLNAEGGSGRGKRYQLEVMMNRRPGKRIVLHKAWSMGRHEKQRKGESSLLVQGDRVNRMMIGRSHREGGERRSRSGANILRCKNAKNELDYSDFIDRKCAEKSSCRAVE